MQKALILVLVSFLLIQTCACAESYMLVGTKARVYNCKEYITLRADPSSDGEEISRIPLNGDVTILEEAEDGFTHVSYLGQDGYVKSEYLDVMVSLGGLSIMSEVTDAQKLAINEFVSSITTTNLMYLTGNAFDISKADNKLLINFAIDYAWFNEHKIIESMDGLYNARMPIAAVNDILVKTLNVTVNDYSDCDYDIDGDHFTWEETGGHMSEGFAILTNIMDNDNGTYDVYFDVFGVGEEWGDSVYAMTIEEASSAYPISAYHGHALIEASSLDEIGTFTLKTMEVTGY